MSVSRVFTSDNCTPISQPILAAIAAANAGMAPSYGADEETARLERVACDLFETELKIFPVATGTAANALALAQIAPPYGAIYCHEAAHIMVDEAGAPEFFGDGTKLIGFPSLDGKITPLQTDEAVAYAREMGVHHVLPSAVSVSQTTEWGGLWLTQARHANAMAASLARGLESIREVSLLRPQEANELFVIMPEPWVKTLETEGFHFYRWGKARSDGVMVRLVTCFATLQDDVDDLLAAVNRAAC